MFVFTGVSFGLGLIVIQIFGFKQWSERLKTFRPVTASVDRAPVVKLAELRDVLAILDDPQWTLLDVRELDYFSQGHIKNAINYPASNIFNEGSNGETLNFGGSHNIIVYCSSPSCFTAFAVASKIAVDSNIQVYVYSGGFTEWSSLSLPTEG
tara:strand:+ start:52 stop:510 length:459 start_codon:yes stop_codon:yes gene_type:complete